VIPGTEDVTEAAFSPDGASLVFGTRQNALLKVSLLGGAPTPVVPAGEIEVREPHWGDAGTIVFDGSDGTYLVPETGGEPELLGQGEDALRNASLLPGGRAVLGARLDGSDVMLLDLETGSVRDLIPGGIDPQYIETGHILYADAAGGLWAAPFDAGRGELLGAAVPVLEGLSIYRGEYIRLSVSRNGTAVYAAGGGGLGGAGRVARQLFIVDLEGDEEPMNLAPRYIRSLDWSPDGRSVVYTGTGLGDSNSDIFTYDVLLATTPVQWTEEGYFNNRAVFSPGGRRIVFSSSRLGDTDGQDLFIRNLDDDTAARLLISLPGHRYTTQWPSDSLIVFTHAPRAPFDLWVLDLSNPDRPRAREYLSSEFSLSGMTVSPDGTHAAYHSNERGRDEVFISSFPVAGERTLVSRGGGQWPRWSPDGQTLYYWAIPDGDTSTFIAARIQRDPTTAVLSTSPLFTGDYDPFLSALHPDGDQLIIARDVSTATESDDAAPVSERYILVTNFFEELKWLMPN